MSKVKIPGGALLAGRLHNLIFYQIGDCQFVRSRPKSVHNPNTLSQIKQRQRLAYITRLAMVFSPVVPYGFPRLRNAQTSYNRFVSENIKRVESFVTPNSDEPERSRVFCNIDPQDILCSKGSLPVHSVEATYLPSSHLLEVRYLPNTLPQEPVHCMLVLYQPDLPRVFLDRFEPSDSDTLHRIALPDSFCYDLFHLYAFYLHPDTGQCSTSIYVPLNCKQS